MDASRSNARMACLLMSLVLFSACNKNNNQVRDPGLNGQTCAPQVVPQSFLVQWKEVPKEFMEQRLTLNGKVTLIENISKDELNKKLEKYPNAVEIAEHNFNLVARSDDELVSTLSTIDAWGPTNVSAPEAWSALGKKGDGVIVAVIDSGVDTHHPLLKDRIWRNPGEDGLDAHGNPKASNGVDDDGNGLIDDINGWNFLSHNNDVEDIFNLPHGTHISGIIAGQSGDDGFVGVAPNATILPLKFIGQSGGGSISEALEGITYAVSKGARVINASWGGTSCSSILKDKIVEATKSGTVYMAAAGNRGVDVNISPEWPSAFIIPGKLSVGAINRDNILATFSNWGVLVDVAAPGDAILSTIMTSATDPSRVYGVMRGTSMAAPFAAGVAALLLSKRPSLSAPDVTGIISGTVITGNQIGVKTRGRINALQAANYLLSH